MEKKTKKIIISNDGNNSGKENATKLVNNVDIGTIIKKVPLTFCLRKIALLNTEL